MTADDAGAAPHDAQGDDEHPQQSRERAQSFERHKRVQSPETIVRRLQARIVKAAEAGRYNKVKALQHLLTHSQSAKRLAVERVSTNEGKKTPGVDGET